MRTPKEIKAEIRQVKADMRADGVRTVSCFNGGLTPAEYRYNSTLTRLKVELMRAGG